MTRLPATAGRAKPAHHEESELCIIVPMLPPTVNHCYRPNGRGGRILTDEAQTFRQVVALEIRDMLMRTGWQLPAGRLEFELKLTYGTRARTDIDNRAKSAIDAVALALGFDDQRIDRVVIERAGYEARRPLCEMIVREFAR
jgi:Holliday junction resolvase RusA-like endonuclease